jgi:hypothetical protein
MASVRGVEAMTPIRNAAAAGGVGLLHEASRRRPHAAPVPLAMPFYRGPGFQRSELQ